MQTPQTFLAHLCVSFWFFLSSLSHCLALTSPRAKGPSPLVRVKECPARAKELSLLGKVKVRPKERELAVSILVDGGSLLWEKCILKLNLLFFALISAHIRTCGTSHRCTSASSTISNTPTPQQCKFSYQLLRRSTSRTMQVPQQFLACLLLFGSWFFYPIACHSIVQGQRNKVPWKRKGQRVVQND